MTSNSAMSVVIITGISGSGKSVALKWLEDVGYACVDNLPVMMLHDFVASMIAQHSPRIAIAIDARSADDLTHLPQAIKKLRGEGLSIRVVFLEANDITLVQRYSESRRRHPLAERLSREGLSPSLKACIGRERELLDPIRDQEHVIDTSGLTPGQLRGWMQDLIQADRQPLILTFESFAFKHGAPRDADLVFDVRCLPNPHYDSQLKALTGKDAAVAQWLDGFEDVRLMTDHIETFVRTWLPRYTEDTRNYLTVAVGCTGGKHRSVYVVEILGKRFASLPNVQIRHRNQPEWA
jgi:UPF0042 nucleotide-binding protein